MSVHTIITNPGIYFITFTCFRWINLIQRTESYDLFYDWFGLLHIKNHPILGYVIMPNHAHLLLYYSGGQKLNTIIGNGKRFMAYKIADRLNEKKDYKLLYLLGNAVRKDDKLNGKKHEIWIPGFDSKPCRTEPFILQKLNYIHFNPCCGKWKLANRPTEYIHSSAAFYDLGRLTCPHLKDYRDFLSLL